MAQGNYHNKAQKFINSAKSKGMKVTAEDTGELIAVPAKSRSLAGRMNDIIGGTKAKKVQPVTKGVPKVRPVQGDVVQSGGIDNAGEISQGLFKGQNLKVSK